MSKAMGLAECSIGYVQRLFSAFSLQLEDIERRASDESQRIADDSKILSGLARTLETLIDLADKTSNVEEAPDIEEARQELTSRISRLMATHEGAADAGPS